MTVLSFLLFSCFQAFSAFPSRPVPLSRPPFVTNLLHQPVSDLFQFYAAFSPLSRLISFSVTFSLPSCLIPFFAVFSLPSRLISFSVTFSLPYCLIPFLLHSRFRPALFHFLLHSRLCPTLFSTSFCYFQCIYNTFSVYFPARSFLSVSLTYTKRIYIIIKCFFECRFGQAKGTGSPLTENQCPA